MKGSGHLREIIVGSIGKSHHNIWKIGTKKPLQTYWYTYIIHWNLGIHINCNWILYHSIQISPFWKLCWWYIHDNLNLLNLTWYSLWCKVAYCDLTFCPNFVGALPCLLAGAAIFIACNGVFVPIFHILWWLFPMPPTIIPPKWPEPFISVLSLFGCFPLTLYYMITYSSHPMGCIELYSYHRLC